MSDKPPSAGRIVWHDLFTSDAPKAEAFYTGLFGWTVTEMAGSDGPPYRMLTAGERGLGGFEPLEAGVPAHWMAYVSVDDVEAACERATAKGGAVLSPPKSLPGIGTIAILRDPTGGVIAPYQSATGGVAPAPAVGEFCWEELLTHDVPTARAFYEHVFAWTSEEMDMGPMGTYVCLNRGDGQGVGGIMQMPPESKAAPYWLPYVMVEDVDAMAEQAKRAGAHQWVPPTDIPGVGRFSAFADPQGASFAIYRSEPEA